MVVQYVSQCFIKLKYTPEGSKQPMFLSPCDLILVSAQYMQKGLLFAKPPGFDMDQFGELVQKIKESPSLTLVHFYPLAGRLAALKKEESTHLTIYIDCNKGSGARFIHASLDLTIDDILSPKYVPDCEIIV